MIVQQKRKKQPKKPKNRPTVGAISDSLKLKTPETLDPLEQAGAMTSTYMDELTQTAINGKHAHPDDFFVVVLTKSERLMPNVIRNYFLHRRTCPTPDYDQAVYHYKKDDDALHFLWITPSKEACIYIKQRPLEIDDDQYELRSYVLDFADGTLAKKAMKLNNEDVLEGKVVLQEVKDEH